MNQDQGGQEMADVNKAQAVRDYLSKHRKFGGQIFVWLIYADEKSQTKIWPSHSHYDSVSVDFFLNDSQFTRRSEWVGKE